jgi:hypothetical protein
MIASRRNFIVSSSHPYHNCKIPFLYEHVMTPFMTPRRRRYLFLLSISSRASTSHIVFAPTMFALHSHSVPCLCHHRSSTITLLANPSISQKFYIIKLLSDSPVHSGFFRLHPVYHVPSELSFLSYLYQYLLLYPGFSYYFDTWSSFLFLIVLWVVLVAFSGNNASQFWDCCFV